MDSRLAAVCLAAAVLASLSATLSLSPAVAGSPPTISPAGDAGSGWIPDVIVAGTAAAEAAPALATGPGGELLMAYEREAGGNRDVYFTASLDGGATWTPSVPVANGPANETEPSIAMDPASGRMFVAYVRGGAEIMVSLSDTGFLWSAQTVYACPLACVWPRVVAEYWNGTDNRAYITFSSQAGANDWDVLVTRSTDRGATWPVVFTSGSAAIDVRYQAAVVVQRGTDGVDRLIMFYRYGATVAGATNGYMEWSEDHGTTWLPRSFWAVNVYTPPSLAAAHNGESVMIAYSTSTSNVVWGIDQDPRNLNWGTSTSWNWWVGMGYAPVLTADGEGSPSAAIGGNFHITFHDSLGPAMLHSSARVTMVAHSEWSPLRRVSDAAADPTGGVLPGAAVTTQFRGATWHPGIAWVDFRSAGAQGDVAYATPGATWTFDTVPSGLRLTVDGVARTAPFSVGFPADTSHAVAALSPQSGGPGVRYLWANWSDGGAQAHSVAATTTDGALTASFRTQYELAIASSVGGVSGAGWYDPGSIVTISASSPVSGGPGVRYAFDGWTGDVVSSSPMASVTIDAPKSVTANWATEYELVVVTDHGSVSGGGWYAAGANATLTLQSVAVSEGGATWRFTGWSGDGSGTASTLTITMDGPKTVTAEWRQDAAIGAGGLGGPLLLLLLLVAGGGGFFFFLWWRRRKGSGSPPAAPAPQAPPEPVPQPAPEPVAEPMPEPPAPPPDDEFDWPEDPLAPPPT